MLQLFGLNCCLNFPPQAQLDETHKLLHEEHKRRFKLEDDNTRLNLELQRIKVTQCALHSCLCCSDPHC